MHQSATTWSLTYDDDVSSVSDGGWEGHCPSVATMNGHKDTTCSKNDSPSDFAMFLFPSMGECVLEAGRGMWGEFL